ncbi:MAG TPA: 5-formyltetrahydrofolate cyclo-ligase [Clostridiales bacterium]|nr:5-formyltetrahydrofolate cyclo-ligase [Clostridiales bacterium]
MEKFIKETKKEIRKEMLKKRDALQKGYVKKQSEKVFKLLKTINAFLNAESFFIYVDFRNEIKTDKIINFLKNKLVLLPKIGGEEMYAVKKEEETKLNKYGILEPKSSNAYTGKIDVCIIPLVACSKKGDRIGFGKGYYDKFLKSTNSLKIGLAYSWQVLDNFESEPFDEKLDIIVTEKEIIEVK